MLIGHDLAMGKCGDRRAAIFARIFPRIVVREGLTVPN